MDIDLLSKMVKELILDNDEVALPGVGSFVAEYVPATFSDRGFTINPPYKRLSFRNKIAENSTILVDFYAKCNKLDIETASKILTEFLSELRNVLESKKVVIFPGLGKLRATKENYFFFVADEDLDIYPEGFGLEPVSLKTHEESPAEVSATMSALRSILNPEEAAPESESPSVSATSDSGAVDPVETLVGNIDTATPVNDTDAESAESHKESPADNQTTAVSSVGSRAEVSVDGVQTEEPVGASVDSAEAATTDETPTASVEAVNVNETPAESEVDSTADGVESVANGETENPGVVTDEKISADEGNRGANAAENANAGTGWKILLWVMVALIALTVTALVAFIVLAHTAPDFIDSILYTPEELDILNWPLSDPE